MKRIAALIFVLFFTTKIFSQPIINRINTYEFSKEIEGVKTVKIKMPYGKSEVVLLEGDTISLRNAGDIFIDIVCTDFPSTASLNKLNSERLAKFYQLFQYTNALALVRVPTHHPFQSIT
jgi:hypothetical protein